MSSNQRAQVKNIKKREVQREEANTKKENVTENKLCRMCEL